MISLWYEDLGFEKNPFSMKPIDFKDALIGYDDEIKKISKLIKDGKFVFIQGKYGRGKTSVLKKIIKKFSGERKLAYFSGNQIHDYLDIDSILIGAGGFWSRLFRIRSEEVILMLDEVQDLNQNDAEAIMDAYEDGYLKSVVIVSASLGFEKANKMFHGLIEKNKFELKGISKDDAVRLIRKRVGELALLPDDIIRKIYDLDSNPRAFLRNCEDACREAIKKGEEVVTEEMVEGLSRF